MDSRQLIRIVNQSNGFRIEPFRWLRRSTIQDRPETWEDFLLVALVSTNQNQISNENRQSGFRISIILKTWGISLQYNGISLGPGWAGYDSDSNYWSSSPPSAPCALIARSCQPIRIVNQPEWLPNQGEFRFGISLWPVGIQY
jgi:hypothetical protein